MKNWTRVKPNVIIEFPELLVDEQFSQNDTLFVLIFVHISQNLHGVQKWVQKLCTKLMAQKHVSSKRISMDKNGFVWKIIQYAQNRLINTLLKFSTNKEIKIFETQNGDPALKL